MKKILLFLFLFVVLSSKIFAQNFTTINFFGGAMKMYSSLTYTIYLNEQLVATIRGDENLQYKIYSEGRISIIILVNNLRLNGSIDVKNGNTLYYWCAGNKVVDEEAFKKKTANIKSTIQQEENKRKPIATLPNSAEEGPKQGTCFLISKKGYMLTNYHVISGAKTVQVKGIGNDFSTLYGADVIAYDVNLDMALLKLKNQNIVFEDVPYAINLTSIQQGSKAFVMGYPMSDDMGEEVKLTDGIISARSGYKGSISHYQFSAPVQPGNSGSPLFNENGDLIAIINSKITEAEGVGYAIKGRYIDAFLKLIDNVSIESTTNSISTLSLSDKASKLKNFVFIVKSE